MVALVTGASGFIGGAITERLIARGEVRGLTCHPEKNRFGPRVRSAPYDFASPDRMRAAFEGVDVFVNTFYVRFDHGGATFEQAVEHTRTLVGLAIRGGVQHIVHVSVSNARESSDLPYYANKARIETIVRNAGADYTILRPALVVGPGDILVNNIAFFLRRLPVFTVFGTGRCRFQPIGLDAFADLAVESIDGAWRGQTIAVAGPRDWTFNDLVRAIRAAVHSRSVILPAPSWLPLAALSVAGRLLHDVVLTADEVRGLTREYLWSADALRRGEDFDVWLARPGIAPALGSTYASELARHFN